MRLLILMAGVLLATGALADDKPKKVTVTKELDKSSPQLSAVANPSDDSDAKENDDQSKTRAQDYNSSRSNTTTAIELDDDSDGDSILTDNVCRNGVDDDCDSATDEQQTLKRPDKAQ